MLHNPSSVRVQCITLRHPVFVLGISGILDVSVPGSRRPGIDVALKRRLTNIWKRGKQTAKDLYRQGKYRSKEVGEQLEQWRKRA